MTRILTDGGVICFETPERTWRFADCPCYVVDIHGNKVMFEAAKAVTEPYRCGTCEGIETVYTDFPGIDGLQLKCRMLSESCTGDIIFELIPVSDAKVKDILWPAPFENPEAEAMTVLPLMRGVLVPNYTGEEFPQIWPSGPFLPEQGRYSCSRSMFMQFFGQYDSKGAVISIFETRYDGGMEIYSGSGRQVNVGARWRESMGTVRYTRRLRVSFMPAGSDFNDIAKKYRAYVKSKGELVTLKQKIAVNEAVKKLYGKPLLHTYAWHHTNPTSDMYIPGAPEKNDRIQTFSQLEEGIRRLHACGLKQAVVHLDGWGKMGYDNQHPDYLPPSDMLGGWSGMKSLQETCHDLGDTFGLHDQYRDYYVDAESFDENNAVRDCMGNIHYHSIWEGGRQTILCQQFAPDYVRRNYMTLAENGIHPDNVYLDVFSCVELDECCHPEHPMSRGDCAQKRGECFRILESMGIITQSEEGIDWAFPYLAFVHHAPFAPVRSWYEPEVKAGIPIPLLDLVYHDCLVIPMEAEVGDEDKYMHSFNCMYALLTGAMPYLPFNADKKTIARTQELADLQCALQDCEMLKLELFDKKARHMKAYYSGGSTVEVNLDTYEYKLNIKCPG